jgi:hypothetical protein
VWLNVRPVADHASRAGHGRHRGLERGSAPHARYGLHVVVPTLPLPALGSATERRVPEVAQVSFSQLIATVLAAVVVGTVVSVGLVAWILFA